MQLKAYALPALILVDVLIVVDVVMGLQIIGSVAVWMILHVICVATAALLVARMLLENADDMDALSATGDANLEHCDVATHRELMTPISLFLFIALFGLTLPGIGLSGIWLTLSYGLQSSRARTYTDDYWTITPIATLPYVAPLDRRLKPVDSRGFTEHLIYSTDDRDIYQKVLASAYVKTSLSIETLKQAMQHSDEKVRLTAYKTLDKKVTFLNKQIQQLEIELEDEVEQGSSDKWLQIASNYWELVTIEGTEVVARQQLLIKAASAAIKAVALLPENRNAHLVLGRISLAQGDTRRATVALKRAQALGMPKDKVLPYLAECAFIEKNLPRVQQLLAGLDSSIIAYPPLSHIVRYWS